MTNKIKVKCESCDVIYWTEYDPNKSCFQCKGDLTEWMLNQSDYDRKNQLDKY